MRLVTVPVTVGRTLPVRLVTVPVTVGRTLPVSDVTVPVRAGSVPAVRLVTVPVTVGRTPPVSDVTVPVRAGSVPAVRLVAVPVRALTVPVTLATVLVAAAWTGSTIGCDPLARPWMAWVALWTTPFTVLVAGEDGACGDVAEVSALTVPVTADVGWLAGAAWAAGCDPLARPWVALWTTPFTVLVTGEDEACGDVAAAGALDAGVPLLLAATWLAGAGWWPGWAVGCDPLTGPWRAWLALWTTPLTVLVTGEDGACVVWLAAGALLAAASTVLDAVLAAAAGASDAGALDAGVLEAGVLEAGVLDAGVLDAGVPLLLAAAWLAGAGWAVDCVPLVADPLEAPWVA